MTFAAISELATFNRNHGAVSEADKAMEYAAKQLEEFSLSSEATQVRELIGRKE